MKNIVFIFLLATLFFACNPEKIKIEGNIKNAPDGVVLVKMKSNKELGERILDTLTLVSGDFDFYTKTIKPPVKLTFVVNDDEEFDVWLGKYGSFQVKGEHGKLRNVKVLGSLVHDEFHKIEKKFYDWYINPVQDKIDWLNSLDEASKAGNQLSSEEELKKADFEKVVRKAYKLQRMSIVKTARKNPGSEVALALVNEKFNTLVPRHKKEMIKLLRKKFGDTALFWQMKN